MAPGKYDLHIYRGEDFSLTFLIEVGGVLLDLTGCTILAEIRPLLSRVSLPVIETFTVTLDGQPTPNAAPTDMEVALTLTDAQTVLIDGYSEGFYDVLVIDTNGVDTYYLSGQVFFHNTVTVKP